MDWYKIAKLETYLDRNRLNSRIRSFKQVAKQLKYLQKYVYQNAPHAKKFVENLASTKEMSSFPKIREKLLRAGNTALDNYKIFAQLCMECQDDIVKLITEMENERNTFVKKDTLKREKENE